MAAPWDGGGQCSRQTAPMDDRPGAWVEWGPTDGVGPRAGRSWCCFGVVWVGLGVGLSRGTEEHQPQGEAKHARRWGHGAAASAQRRNDQPKKGQQEEVGAQPKYTPTQNSPGFFASLRCNRPPTDWGVGLRANRCRVGHGMMLGAAHVRDRHREGYFKRKRRNQLVCRLSLSLWRSGKTPRRGGRVWHTLAEIPC